MNGSSPGTPRSTSAGAGLPASATVGNRTAERDAEASDRRTRYSPTKPGASASPATTAPPNRNRRRSSPAGNAASTVSTSSRLTIGARPARPRNQTYAHSPAAIPANDGTDAGKPVAGRVTAATAPMVPKMISPIMPATGRRSDTIPRTIAAMVSTIPTPTRSAVLSSVPNVSIAKRFSHSGAASTAAAPTARIGELPAPIRPARSVTAPIATAPDKTPIAAPAGQGTPGGSCRADVIRLLCLDAPVALRRGRRRGLGGSERGRPHNPPRQQQHHRTAPPAAANSSTRGAGGGSR